MPHAPLTYAIKTGMPECYHYLNMTIDVFMKYIKEEKHIHKQKILFHSSKNHTTWEDTRYQEIENHTDSDSDSDDFD